MENTKKGIPLVLYEELVLNFGKEKTDKLIDNGYNYVGLQQKLIFHKILKFIRGLFW